MRSPASDSYTYSRLREKRAREGKKRVIKKIRGHQKDPNP